MSRKLIILCLVIYSGISFAIEKDKKSDQLEKDLVILARENNTETVKNYCIKKWSEPQSIEINSKFSTVAEFCTCVQEEMNYLISDVLSENLFKMQIQTTNKSTNQYLTDDEVSNTATQWFEKYSIADRACREKFMRKKR